MPKISELNAITSVANTDLLMVVHDPNGSPSTNKITVNNFIISTGLNTLADVGDLGEILVSNGTSSVWKKNPDVRAVGAIFDRTSYTATLDDSVILVVPATQSAAITITLPTVGVPVGKVYSIRNIDSSFGQYPVIVNAAGSVLEDPHFNTPVSSYNVQYTGDVETWIFDGLSYRNISSLSSSPVFRGSANSFQQVVLQNVSDANNASGDYVVYNDEGSYLNGTGPFVDMGINSSNYDSTEYGNVWTQSDSYLYNMGGNLIIGPETNHSIKFIANGTDSDDVQLTVNSSAIYIKNNIVLSSGSDITRNGESVLATPTMLSPNIAYTGVFNGYPGSLPVTKGEAVFFTSNGYVLDTTNKYWLKYSFYTGDYDLSGVETLDFRNIGGIGVDFSLGGKSENLLTDINLHDIAAIGDDFYIRDLPALETFSANNLVYVNRNFEIYSMNNANTQFNFPNLNRVATFYYTWNDVLENTPQFPALKTVNNLYIYHNSATQNTMTFDSLDYVGYMSIYQNSGMVDGPDFAALVTGDYFDINNNDSMINPPQFTALETMNSSFYFYEHDLVTTAPNTASLVSANYIGWYDNPSMANGINFSSLKEVNGDVNMSGCALDQASIDYVLETLDSLDSSNGTTTYSSRTVTLNGGTNAIPSANGLAAKAGLEARSCTVNVNS
jgi:hypothetical protein